MIWEASYDIEKTDEDYEMHESPKPMKDDALRIAENYSEC